MKKDRIKEDRVDEKIKKREKEEKNGRGREKEDRCSGSAMEY